MALLRQNSDLTLIQRDRGLNQRTVSTSQNWHHASSVEDFVGLHHPLFHSRHDLLLQPESVAGWNGAGPKFYWRWISGHRNLAGEKCLSIELRDIIFRMVAENRT